MALVECKECKSEISNNAKSCPKCGAKQRASFGLKILLKWFLIIFIVIPFLISFIGYLTQNNNVKASSKFDRMKTGQAYIVSAHQLASDYNANEARADAQYKGKLLEITGRVDSISKDFSDETVVNLEGVQMFQTIHASLLFHNDKAALSLDKGMRVKMRCYGDGEIIGSPMLKDCILI